MAGFTRPTTTQTPDALFDYWLTRLTGGELRVLLYAIRRTFGFRKDDDDISIQQFMHGITTAEGKILDEGTGLSRQSVITATDKLSQKGLLIKTRQRLGDNRDAVNNYRLRVFDPRNPRAEVGYRAVNTTQVPDEIFDYWLPRHSDGELFVLLYIVRRTLGFSKPSDIITEKQFLSGVKRRDGSALDEGCGVSRNTLYLALKGLQGKGLISIQRRMSATLGKVAPVYGLVFEADRPAILAAPDPRRGTMVEDVDPTPRPVGGCEDEGVYREGYGGQGVGTRGSSQHDVGVETVVHGGQIIASGQSSRRQMGIKRRGQGSQGIGMRGANREEKGYARRLDPQQTACSQDEQETASQQTYVQETGQQERDSSKPSSDIARDYPSGDARREAHDVPLADGPRLFSAYIDQIVRDFTREFHDPENARSNRTQAYNLWHTSGLSEQNFANLLYIARDITRERVIEKRASNGPVGQRNKMPYFFAVVRRELTEAGFAVQAREDQTQGDEAEQPGDDTAGSQTRAMAIWRAVLDELRSVLTTANYETWLSQTRALDLDGDLLRVGVPKVFHRDWLQHKLGGRIQDTLRRLGYDRLHVEYVVAPHDARS